MYDGEWLRDKAHGWGIKYFANGDFHEGEYVCDRREGYGMYKWHNGDQYEGNWTRGEQSGIGCYSFQNKDLFHGTLERWHLWHVSCMRVYSCVLIVFFVAWLFPRVVPRVIPLAAVLVVPVSQANGNGVENTGWVFLKSTSL